MNKPNELVDPNQHLMLNLTTQLLRDGQSVRFRAPGRSMYPTIREGEAITVEPILPSEVKVGDIILYRSDDGVIAHRVTRIERGENDGRRFILRADTWGEYDEPVYADQVMGKVVSTERGGRSINPYCTGARARLLIHTIASRLKHHIL